MDDDFEKWRKQVEKDNDHFIIGLYAWVAVILVTVLLELI